MDPVAGWFGLAAVIITTVGTIVVTVLTSGTRKAARATHEEVRTNHGMRAGEYLERVAELGISLELLHAEVKNLGGRVATRTQLDEHADSDLDFQRQILARLGDNN